MEEREVEVEIKEDMIDFGNLKIEEIYDENEVQSTNLKQLKNENNATELSFDELQELYVSISKELKELENKKK